MNKTVRWEGVRKSGTIIFVMMVLPNIVSLISALVVSQLGTVQLAGVSVGIAVFAVISAVPAAFATAQQVIVSRYEGLGSAWGALSGTRHILKRSAFLSSLISILAIPGLLWIAHGGWSQEVHFAAIYLAGRLLSIVPLLITALLGTLIFLGGGRRIYLESIFLNAIITVPLCIILTLGFGKLEGFGVLGDGIAGTVAGFLSIGYLLTRARSVIDINSNNSYGEMQNAYDRDFSGQGFNNWNKFVFPLVGSNVFDYVCTLSMVALTGLFGSAFVAAFRVGQNLQLIYFAVVASVVMGVVIEANRNVAGGPHRVSEESLGYLKMTAFRIVLVAVLCVVFGGGVFYAFAGDNQFRSALLIILILAALASVPCTWAYIWVGQLRVFGGTGLEMKTNIMALLIFQVPSAVLFGWLFGGPGVFCGFVIYWIGRGILSRSAAKRLCDRYKTNHDFGRV